MVEVWTSVTSRCLEGLLPQLRILRGKKSTDLIWENQWIVQKAIVENLHISAASVIEIIEGLDYKNFVFSGATSASALNEESKTGNMSVIDCLLRKWG